MTPDLKAKWITRLRSGSGKMAQKGLRRPEGFCPLGVLLDIIDPDGWESPVVVGKEVFYPHRLAHKLRPKGGTGVPSEKTLQKIGLSNKDSFVIFQMNDMGKPVSEIIDYIWQKV